jgi:hypothetical protein
MRTYVVVYQDSAHQVYGWFCQAEGPGQAAILFNEHITVKREIKTILDTQLVTIDTLLELYKYREEITPDQSQIDRIELERRAFRLVKQAIQDDWNTTTEEMQDILAREGVVIDLGRVSTLLENERLDVL